MSTISRAPRWIAGLVGVALALGSAAPALAHNVVEDRDPAADSVVTQSPVTVSISTNDSFLDTGDATRGFAIVAQDGAGLYYGDGCVNIDERTMSATIDLGRPGTYTVLYQFVSADGHTLQDSYTFVFEPGADHGPAVGLVAPPVCGATTEDLPVEEITPELIVPAEEIPVVADDTVSVIPSIVGIAVLLVLLIGLGVSGLRKRQAKS
ncbi:MAG: copper resistance protein CopC [Pontimonas sp.]|nr:copper resistance protein CopC [Pontimonas sp.]